MKLCWFYFIFFTVHIMVFFFWFFYLFLCFLPGSEVKRNNSLSVPLKKKKKKRAARNDFQPDAFLFFYCSINNYSTAFGLF